MGELNTGEMKRVGDASFGFWHKEECLPTSSGRGGFGGGTTPPKDVTVAAKGSKEKGRTRKSVSIEWFLRKYWRLLLVFATGLLFFDIGLRINGSWKRASPIAPTNTGVSIEVTDSVTASVFEDFRITTTDGNEIIDPDNENALRLVEKLRAIVKRKEEENKAKMMWKKKEGGNSDEDETNNNEVTKASIERAVVSLPIVRFPKKPLVEHYGEVESKEEMQLRHARTRLLYEILEADDHILSLFPPEDQPKKVKKKWGRTRYHRDPVSGKITTSHKVEKEEEQPKLLPSYFVSWPQFLRESPRYDANLFDGGRGIVLCAGGLRYMGPLWVTVNALRRMGNTLPIEVWSFGGEQPTPMLMNDFRELDVSFVTPDEILPGGSTIFNGFNIKIFAVIFSRFSEIIFIDSDNLPLRDPAFLFETKEYRENRALFWPDYWRASVSDNVLLALGIEPSTWTGTHDSGQIVLDKRRGWDALMLASFLSLHSADVFPLLTLNGLGIGDKEVLPLCYRALNLKHHSIQHVIVPIGVVSTERKFKVERKKNHAGMREFEALENEDKSSESESSSQKDTNELSFYDPSKTKKMDINSKHLGKDRALSVRVDTTFHGTTMGQHDPSGKLIFLHKNCDKWVVMDSLEDGFLETRGFTHAKLFNRTDVPFSETWDFRPDNTHAFAPRSPRKPSPSAVCEVDVDNEPVVPLSDIFEYIKDFEFSCRVSLRTLALSESYEEYVRWRNLRFGEDKTMNTKSKVDLTKLKDAMALLANTDTAATIGPDADADADAEAGSPEQFPEKA